LKGLVTFQLLAAIACTRQQEQPRPGPVPPTLTKYEPVTAARLENPEDGDWVLLRRTYNGWGYSPLDEINTRNVNRLQPAWVLSTGLTDGHVAPPLVSNGVMFVTTPGNRMMAIDVRTGTVLWRYRRNLPEDALVVHRANRGVALYGDKIYFASADAILVAIDARSGREVWTAKVEENSTGYYMTMAPLVADGKVIVGVSGGELGIRGFVAAYDVDSGAERWKTFTVPAPGEPGSEAALRRG
jgi:alcohol dehydrogenase (cytochrome c)